MRMIIAAAVLACAGIGGAQAGVLERAKETGELRIGYRTDAQPFSFKDLTARPRAIASTSAEPRSRRRRSNSA